MRVGILARSFGVRYAGVFGWLDADKAHKICLANGVKEASVNADALHFGERKIVTILFADIEGSVSLTAGLDPERIDEILSRIVAKMRQAVNRYDGIVNRISGDGIMAIFGAPLALEHHAQQACHAALAILEEVQEEDPVEEDIGPIRIRVGLNSGEVVIRELTSDRTVQYEAIGEVVSIAARMEQAARPGHVVISSETRRLAGDAIRVRSLGHQPVRGLARPFELFDLLGISRQHDRRTPAALGKSRFVGRRAELATLVQGVERALAGNGGTVIVTGEAGSGKSRLVQELLHCCEGRDLSIVRGYSRSFGQRGYHLIIEMLEVLFGVDDLDSSLELREKIRQATCSIISPAPAERAGAIVQALTALCDPTSADQNWLALDPSERRSRIMSAACELFRRVAGRGALVLVAEDLHWIDDDSLYVLENLAEIANACRILIVSTARNQTDNEDTMLAMALRCPLAPLKRHETRELLRVHLAESGASSAFENYLIGHTGGNPLFVEECLASLVETGDLVGERSEFRLARPVVDLKLPSTVRALIGARLDRLSSLERDVLQAGSVIGETVPQEILAAVVTHDSVALTESLQSLCVSQFLRLDESRPTDQRYVYRHALTRETVYQGMLLSRRRRVHGRVVLAIERIHKARILDYAETLSEHAERAEDWSRAVHYLRESARKAVARSSNRTAIGLLTKALTASERLPDESQKTSLADVLLELRFPLFKQGEIAEVSRVLFRAGETIRELKDPYRLALLHAYQSHLAWVAGDSFRALVEARASRRAAEQAGNRALAVRARFQEGMVLTSRGAYSDGIAALSELLEHVTAGFGAGVYPDVGMATIAECYMARAFAEIGDFAQARSHAEASLELAGKIEDPFSKSFAAMAMGYVDLSINELETAIEWLEQARETAMEVGADYLVPFPTGFLGMAYVLGGRADRAIPMLESTIERADAMGFRGSQPYRIAALGRAYLACERFEDALRTANDAFEMACLQGEVYAQALALCVLADASRATGGRQDADGYLIRALALARAHGLLPIEQLCQRALDEERAIGRTITGGM